MKYHEKLIGHAHIVARPHPQCTAAALFSGLHLLRKVTRTIPATTMSTDRYDRHRIDQPLDDIAAAMEHNTTTISFGEDYQERDYVGAPIRGVSSSSSKRHAPYSSSRSSRGRDRSERERSLDREDSPSNRVFVANLSYATTWQSLKDHMRQGKSASLRLFILFLWVQF